MEEFEKTLRLMLESKGKTIGKVLITASSATDALLSRCYFDEVITLEDIFNTISGASHYFF